MPYSFFGTILFTLGDIVILTTRKLFFIFLTFKTYGDDWMRVICLHNNQENENKGDQTYICYPLQ